jgi:hypothetical protein
MIARQPNTGLDLTAGSQRAAGPRARSPICSSTRRWARCHEHVACAGSDPSRAQSSPLATRLDTLLEDRIHVCAIK